MPHQVGAALLNQFLRLRCIHVIPDSSRPEKHSGGNIGSIYTFVTAGIFHDCIELGELAFKLSTCQFGIIWLLNGDFSVEVQAVTASNAVAARLSVRNFFI